MKKLINMTGKQLHNDSKALLEQKLIASKKQTLS